MSVEHLEVLVEEPSMEVVMRRLLPGMLGTLSFAVYQHSCKAELLARLPQRLLGYSRWLPNNWRIAIVVDRDDEDCYELKYRLENIARKAGLATKSMTQGQAYNIINRVVIEELEAWYFGDWHAVCAAYPRVPGNIPRKSRYRDPDAITGGTWEAFEKILQRAGYFLGGLRKIEAASSIAPYMEPERNCSKSFQVFSAALQEMAIS